MKNLLVLWILIFGNFSLALSQEVNQVELANEYFKQGEYEKAKELFQKLAKDKDNARVIHTNYAECLLKLKNFEEVDKFLKKQIKNNETNLVYKGDLALFYETTGKMEESKKTFDDLINTAVKNEANVYEMQDFFYRNQKNELVIELLKKAREQAKNDSKYAAFMARAYLMAGQKDMMIDEVLKFGLAENNIDYVKATLQDNIKDDKELDMLEKALYSKVQKFPNEQYYADMLIWHLLQQKEFYKAFIQTRALDRRYKMDGQRVFELAALAYQNKDYKDAAPMYDYIIKEYPQGVFYSSARRFAIQCKEEVVKNTFPVNKVDILNLISDYNQLFQEVGKNQKTMDAMRNSAQLYAFYLDDKEKAVAILDSAIAISGANQEFKDRCKLDLGDIYILKNEPWEATLLYSQVEKSEKEEQLGQEAKLRNAKLHYFNGEFDLAKSILDVLKQATTREISNDAIQLSLLIQDNTGMDSTETAMRDYSAVELLLFQNKNEEALTELDKIFEKYKTHSLSDEILFLKATTLLKINEPEKAIKVLDLLLQNYKYDILADDALFLMAKINDEKFNNKEKAMELYREVLQKYPGSLYGAEARKRFRNLRGDTIN